MLVPDSKRIVTLVCCLLLLAAVAAPAQAQFLVNRAPMMPADAAGGQPGTAALYPSTIVVPPAAGAPATLEHIFITLNGIAHPRSGDLDILLVPPAESGRAPIVLMSDTSVPSLTGKTISFSDQSNATLDGPPDLGAYRATNIGAADVFPGFGGGFADSLVSLRGMNPAGEWKLYVVDDQAGLMGGVTRGWSLSITASQQRTQSSGIIVQSPQAIAAVQLAQPSPSQIVVSDLPGTVENVRVTLHGLTHGRPDDLEIVLRSPAGVCVGLMSDAGGAGVVSGLDLTFARLAASIPDGGPLQSGVWGASDWTPQTIDVDLSTAATGCASITNNMGALTGSPNGTWSLFVGDDGMNNNGTIESWTLHFDMQAEPAEVFIATPNSANLTGEAGPITLGGTVEPGPAPFAAIRWIVQAFEAPSAGIAPHTYLEGPWLPLAPFASTWSLPNVPLPWGTGQLVVEIRDVNGLISTDYLPYTNDKPRTTLAEGATGTFFDLDVTIFNPTSETVPASIEFLTPAGLASSETRMLAPHQRVRIPVDTIPGLEQATVSTVVTAQTPAPLVVERTMFWGGSRYGGHGGNSAEPSTTWYFAEGADGFFQTFLLLSNPADTAAQVTIRFLLENGTPIDETRTLAPHSRDTVDTGAIAGLRTRAFGMLVQADRPIMAERAMYFSNANRLWEGGHESTGVPRPSTEWLLAEGATGGFFDTFVLAANPSAQAGEVTMRFMTANGDVVTKAYDLPAWGRVSINVEHEHPLLANAAVSTRVNSTVPIVVERAMYWPGGPGEWNETHGSTGLTTLGTSWAVADGRLGGVEGFSTYILLVNPTDMAAEVDVRLVRSTGEEIATHVVVPAHSRYTVDGGASAPAWAADGEFSALLSSTNAVPFAVERATYWNSEGRFWSGGVSVLGTRIR